MKLGKVFLLLISLAALDFWLQSLQMSPGWGTATAQRLVT
jgi:hypothetical protein